MSKVVIVSGCSSGIGLAVARALRQRADIVVATARQPADVERLKAEGFSEAMVLDVTDDEQIATVVHRTIERHGRIDAIFANAGFAVPGATEDLDRRALRAQFETNVFGAILFANAVLPQMRKQGGGRILFNSSVLGFAALKMRGAYNASKFALEGFADTLRLELRGTGIHVALIEPGPIATRFRANALLMYRDFIHPERSVHRTGAYPQLEARLAHEGEINRFTLPAEACVPAALHAIDAPRPRIRYRITTPTRLLAILKRLLPARLLDAVLARAE